MPEKNRICVLIPVYNDWRSVLKLVEKIDAACASGALEAAIVLVNDGSTESAPVFEVNQYDYVRSITVLELHCNQGSQRAIALGLAYVAGNLTCQTVCIMDADGEDKPEDLLKLYQAATSNPDSIAVAERSGRNAGCLLKAGYWFYRKLFRILTGENIRFGNFCAIPKGILSRLVHNPELWNNLAGCLKRSRYGLVKVPCDRGIRYHGHSSMNASSLVTHGMSVISIYWDIISARLFLVSSGVIAVMCLLLCAVVLMRIFTELPVTGWSTIIAIAIIVVILQTVTLMLLTLLHLSYKRSVPLVIPALQFNDYIQKATVYTLNAPATP